MPFRTLCVLLRRRASRAAFPRLSVRNDQPQYRATLRVVCLPDALRPPAMQSVENCIPTLERAERSTPISCDAPRRMPFRTLCVLLRRRASGTALPRWSGGTISPNIVRRSASYAFPDDLRPLATQSVGNCIPTLERAERSAPISCGAPRRMPFRTLCVLLRRRACGTRGVRENTSRNYAQRKRFRRGCYLAKEYSPPCSNALRYAGLPCSRSTHAVTFG